MNTKLFEDFSEFSVNKRKMMWIYFVCVFVNKNLQYPCLASYNMLTPDDTSVNKSQFLIILAVVFVVTSSDAATISCNGEI